MSTGGARSAVLRGRGDLPARRDVLEWPLGVACLNVAVALVFQIPRHVKPGAPTSHVKAACSLLQEGQRRGVVVVSCYQEEGCRAGHHHIHVNTAATQGRMKPTVAMSPVFTAPLATPPQPDAEQRTSPPLM